MVMSSRARLTLLIVLPLLIAACILLPLLLRGDRGGVPESSSAGNQEVSPLGDEAAAAQLVATSATPDEPQLAVSSPDMQQLAPPVPDDTGGSNSTHKDEEGDAMYEDEESNVFTSVDWDVDSQQDKAPAPASNLFQTPTQGGSKSGKSKSSKVEDAPLHHSVPPPTKPETTTTTTTTSSTTSATMVLETSSKSKKDSKSGKSKSSKVADVPLHSVPSPTKPEKTTSTSSTTSATMAIETTSTAISEVTATSSAATTSETTALSATTSETASTTLPETTSATDIATATSTTTPFVGPDNRIIPVDCNCFPVIDIDFDQAIMFIKFEQLQFLEFNEATSMLEPTTTITSGVNYDPTAVSISGDTAVVGDSGSGQVHVFERDFSGTWSNTTVISQPDDSNPGAYFGSDVAIDNDVIVIGASMIGDDFDTGAVYVYRRSQDGWVQEAKLVADDTMDSPYEEFGRIVSIKGNIIVVGDEYYGQANKGAAYVFEYDAEAGSWIQIGSPITTDECELGYFGSSVGIMENGNLLISCNRDNGKTGAVYYFARSGAEYVMQQKIVASDGSVGDEFGGSFKTIAVDGDTAIIGTNKRERVYVFNLQDDVWTEVSYIDEPAGFDIVQFGSNLALSANRVLIRSSGNAYFYQLPLNKMFE
jgi:hypothetical protein